MEVKKSNFDRDSLVSVIVPVYNCAATISETIKSVQAQTYPYWELICVDDGSTDNGESIINEFCENDSRIQYIRRDRQPKGGSVCRNIGAFSAKGNYLIFLDGDDLLVRTCLENRLRVIKETSADFVVFPMASFKDDPTQAKKCSRTDVKNMKYYFASAQGGWQVTSPIYRKAFFKSLNGFNEAFPRLQDIELHLRIILFSHGNYIVRDDVAPDCLYRMGDHHYSQQKILNGLKAHRLFFDLLQDNINLFDNSRNRSAALLGNFCNIFVELNTLYKKGCDVSVFDDLVNSSLLSYLKPTHKVLYSCFKKTYKGRSIFFVKVARKFLLERFIRFA